MLPGRNEDPATGHGDGGLATVIQQVLNGNRRCDDATVTLTVDEQIRVHAVLQDWLGKQDPD